MVAILVALAAMSICIITECVHVLRCRRVSYLAFGAAHGAWAAALGAAVARVLACGVACWGFIVLIKEDAGQWTPDDAQRGAAHHHVVIALDVSPSMQLTDAGPTGDQTRAERARDAVRSILDRLDLQALRISVVAFYSEARPVVVDTFDLNVVDNILDDLPLEHAFSAGKTNLYSSVAAAGEIGRKWRPRSATLIVVSDGDTLPASEIPKLPAAFSGKIVLGVGNPFRGKFIHDHISRQDARSLRRMALQLGGIYNDTNEKHVPSEVLSRLDANLPVTQRKSFSQRHAALMAVGLSAGLLALLSPALAVAIWLIGRGELSGRRRRPAVNLAELATG